MNITDRQADYVKSVVKSLRLKGIRVDSDLRNERSALVRSIRYGVPFQLVVGDREMENGQVAIRTRSGEDLGSMSLEEAIAKIGEDLAQRLTEPDRAKTWESSVFLLGGLLLVF